MAVTPDDTDTSRPSRDEWTTRWVTTTRVLQAVILRVTTKASRPVRTDTT